MPVSVGGFVKSVDEPFSGFGLVLVVNRLVVFNHLVVTYLVVSILAISPLVIHRSCIGQRFSIYTVNVILQYVLQF